MLHIPKQFLLMGLLRNRTALLLSDKISQLNRLKMLLPLIYVSVVKQMVLCLLQHMATSLHVIFL